MQKRASRQLRWVALAVAGFMSSCAISDSKHSCAMDADCLEERVCLSGFCEARPTPETAGEGGGGGVAGESGVAGSSAGGVKGGNERGRGASASGEGGASGGSGASGEGGACGGCGVWGEGSASGSGASGEGGVSGSGVSGEGGVPSSEGGSGGDEAQGEPACDPSDHVIVRECTNQLQFMPVEVSAGVAVVGQTFESTHAFDVIVSKAGSDAIGVNWTNPDFTWAPMQCFDAIPEPRRGAGATLRNASIEFYLIGYCGALYQRSMELDPSWYWSRWTSIKLPETRSFVTDVAATLGPDGINVLYVRDRGKVYRTYRPRTENPYHPFGPWRAVAERAGPIIAAGTRSDSRDQIFTIDAEGRPLTAVQTEADLDAGFGGWTDFGADSLPPLIDIECLYASSVLELFALDRNHELWTREQATDETFAPWRRLELEQPAGAEALSPFWMIAASALPEGRLGAMMLVGVGQSGVYARVRQSDGSAVVWEPAWTEIGTFGEP